ncbi:hypothetical protein JMN32_13915 [Fulvivirga sp. 29W222]|uniref:Septum formation inhibitor Maf n=1 Tax=Fulvivirga marina TaxID=2494733 RepID=A0A937KCI2_9BACT|nr:hypothetical protein [Fulvivirga marina]MBL6447409.1 hypothetical protein [Fulvivirga marina]
MKSSLHIIVFTLVYSGLWGCQQPIDTPKAKRLQKLYKNEQFSEYWYSGKAEVASYNLKQSRYGEVHEGKAVFIFVTEPFSKSKQVKLDVPKETKDDEVTVMKLNFTKKFTTGIYPYSMMLSAFTPVDRYHYPKTLKVTMSSQEWCGHVYSQMNLEKKKYRLKSFSYFESEGDQEVSVETALLEDQVWNQIRLDYKSLPVGKVKIIPGLFFTRLKHKDLKPLIASASLQEKTDHITYQIYYPERALSIHFSKEFPYQILSWEETYKGIGGKELTTSATLDRTLHIDYWAKNNITDSYLRDSLNLK